MYNKKMLMMKVGALLCALSLSAAYAEPSNPKDPYEPFNRVMFKFNDFLDTYIVKPIATIYNNVTPKLLRQGLSNFYLNIDTIPTIFNDVLQGNFYQAANDVWRLGINSTVGLLGFIDVGSRIGLEPNTEDFGLTLARWGWANSNYLVLPFIGPMTVRDTVGFPVNYYYLSIYPRVEPDSARYVLYGAGILVRRADLLRFENVMQQAALDKYVFIRDAYLQRRHYLIERNKQLGSPYGEEDEQSSDDVIDNTVSPEVTAATEDTAETVSNGNTAATTEAGKQEVRTQEATRPFSDL